MRAQGMLRRPTVGQVWFVGERRGIWMQVQGCDSESVGSSRSAMWSALISLWRLRDRLVRVEMDVQGISSRRIERQS